MTHEERRERRAAIAKAVADGNSVAEVCASFGVTSTTARNACEDFGVTLSKSHPNEKFSVYGIIADLINTSDSIVSLGGKYHVSHQRIHQIYAKAKMYGIPVRERSKNRVTLE